MLGQDDGDEAIVVKKVTKKRVNIFQLVSLSKAFMIGYGYIVGMWGSGESRAQQLDRSRCWALPFLCLSC